MQTPLKFVSSHRATFHQLDPYGHLNTLFYLEYFLTHSLIGMREALDLDMRAIAELPFAFINRKVDLEFLLPVTADRLFHISSWISHYNDFTCRVECEMADDEGRLLSRCKFYTVCVDKETQKLTRWPKGFMLRFLEAVEREASGR